MRSIYCFFILLILQKSFSQNANVILQVNGEVLNGSIANMNLRFSDDKNTETVSVDYYPGDLIIDENTWAIIKSDTINNFFLNFDYYTYKKGKQQIANFDVPLNKVILNGRYLIVDIYDFRDKQYKKWYQYITKNNYLVQLIYPGSGLYIRMK